MLLSNSVQRLVNWMLFVQLAIWLSRELLILELRCSRFEGTSVVGNGGEIHMNIK